MVMNIKMARAKEDGAQVVNCVKSNVTENSTTDANVESLSFSTNKSSNPWKGTARVYYTGVNVSSGGNKNLRKTLKTSSVFLLTHIFRYFLCKKIFTVKTEPHFSACAVRSLGLLLLCLRPRFFKVFK